MTTIRIKHFLAAATIGLVCADVGFAQDAAAPIRRSSPSPTPEQTPTPKATATATPRPTVTPTPTAAATNEPTAAPTESASEAPQETAAARPTAAPAQTPAEVPTAKAVSEQEEPPARAATRSRRVLQEKPVRAIERRPASLPRAAPGRADDAPAARSNFRDRVDNPPVLPPASRPTFDLTDQGSGYVGATIRALEQRWQKALEKHDFDTIEDLIADDFVGTSTTGRLGSKSTLLYELKRDKNTYTSATARRMVVRSQGARTAVVTGISKERGTTPDGRRFSNSRRFTDTWVERNGRWQCIASHVTQLPN